MPLTLSLLLGDRVFGPGDPVRPYVILENSGAAPARIPLLDGSGHSSITLNLTCPDGSHVEFPLPDDSGHPPQEGSGKEELLDPGSARLRAFGLDGIVNARTKGEYTLDASLAIAPEQVFSNTIGWFQEQEGAVSVAVPAHRGQAEPEGDCFHVFSGERSCILYRDCLSAGDPNIVDPLRVSSTLRLSLLSPGAHSLTALMGIEPLGAREDRWAGWLDAEGVHATVEMLGPQQACCPIPFRAARIAPHILPAPGGACDVLVVGEDQMSMALVRFGKPVPKEIPVPPDDESLPTDESSETKAEITAEDDDEPLFPVQVPAPRLLWVHRFPRPFEACTLAGGGSDCADMRGLIVTAPGDSGVDVFYSVFRGDESPERFESILIADANLLPNCAPAAGLDRKGRAHVVLLVKTRSPERVGQHVAVARISFGTDGRPHLDRGTTYHETAALPAEPLSGAVSMFINDNGGPWIIDWCVLLDQNRCLTSSRYREAQLRQPDTAIALPLTLLSYGESCFLATRTDQGSPGFIECL